MFYVGVDPGVSGGIGVLQPSQKNFSRCYKMPETETDILNLFQKLKAESNGEIKALIEKVHATPIQGVKSAFMFGGSYYGLRMAMLATGISFEEVQPSKWQLLLGCRTKGDKNVSKNRAQELFPELKITHAVADALLIAEYLKRSEQGTLYQEMKATVIKTFTERSKISIVEVFDL